MRSNPGSFGKVKLVKHKKDDKYSCAKIMKKDDIIKAKQADHIINEVEILSSISHPFIVTLHLPRSTSMESHKIPDYYISSWNTYPEDNSSHIFENKAPSNHIKQGIAYFIFFRFYAAQIVQIFEYLHSKNIIYRDLKPENVLIGQDGYIKLTDFGFAKIVENRTFTLCGTP